MPMSTGPRSSSFPRRIAKSTISASRAWANSAMSAPTRRSPTLSITPPGSGSASCRSGSKSCWTRRRFRCERNRRSAGCCPCGLAERRARGGEPRRAPHRGGRMPALPALSGCTQVVPGEGAAGAYLMVVGEQPGDLEDLAGKPFVGAAGRILDRALDDAGIARGKVFVTNAVKHFKYEQRGKRRLHKRPNADEIESCRWWLDLERAMVKPTVILALGATAARSLLGRPVTLAKT